MRRLLVVLLVAAAALVGGRAYAHHSFAATYLEDQTVSIEGELVQFLFRNPHSFVHVQAPDENGAEQLCVVEWTCIGQLVQAGVQLDREWWTPGSTSGRPARPRTGPTRRTWWP